MFYLISSPLEAMRQCFKGVVTLRLLTAIWVPKSYCFESTSTHPF
jgi:hypothetical protein